MIMRGLKSGILAAVLLLSGPTAWSIERQHAPVPRSEGWLVKSFDELMGPAPPTNVRDELVELKAIMARRTASDVERAHWWSVGGPAYRWNEIAIDELLDNFITLPLAARHLALLHAAMDDAIAAASHNKQAYGRPGPGAADSSVTPASLVQQGSSYPSEYAAAAAAASEVLGYIFPGRTAAFAARAEEAIQSRLMAGAEYPSDASAGRALGQRIAGLAIARGKADGSDAKWTGSVPDGPGKWKGMNPVAPMAATWRPWVLVRQDEVRPPAPPEFDSEQVKRDLVELKAFQRTPKSNHRSVYWEVFGGARAHALWNDIARTKLLEYGYTNNAQVAARVLAALNVAFLDAAIACWDAKYAYWYVRPSQLDSELKPVFPPPNHPSYPAAHGCLSTAASTVLAELFPRDRDRLLALGDEAAEARIWAGIHYRFDVDAGRTIGRKVAEKVLAQAFVIRAK
jgi:membrane-associated phospholipid phosphatase